MHPFHPRDRFFLLELICRVISVVVPIFRGTEKEGRKWKGKFFVFSPRLLSIHFRSSRSLLSSIVDLESYLGSDDRTDFFDEKRRKRGNEKGNFVFISPRLLSIPF